MGLLYEDFHIGQEWLTPRRTVGESDLINFAGLTGDMHPLHTDAVYCRDTPFGERIAHGFLVASLASGLGYRLHLTDGTVLANLGTSWKFQAPVKIGDTIHVLVRVTEMRPSGSNPQAGIVKREYLVRNQRDEACAAGEVTVLVRRRSEGTSSKEQPA